MRRKDREEGRKKRKEGTELTSSLVHSGIDHETKLREAGFPPDVAESHYPFGPCQAGTVPPLIQHPCVTRDGTSSELQPFSTC